MSAMVALPRTSDADRASCLGYRFLTCDRCRAQVTVKGDGKGELKRLKRDGIPRPWVYCEPCAETEIKRRLHIHATANPPKPDWNGLVERAKELEE